MRIEGVVVLLHGHDGPTPQRITNNSINSSTLSMRVLLFSFMAMMAQRPFSSTARSTYTWQGDNNFQSILGILEIFTQNVE